MFDDEFDDDLDFNATTELTAKSVPSMCSQPLNRAQTISGVFVQVLNIKLLPGNDGVPK